MNTWQIKLLYDGECPMCRREMHWLKRRDRNDRLALEDITAPGFDAGKYGLTREQVNRVMYGVLPDGSVVSRLEAFRRAYAAVGLGWLARPTGWPVLRPIFDLGYLLFARNRLRIGRLFGGPQCESGSCSR